MSDIDFQNELIGDDKPTITTVIDILKRENSPDVSIVSPTLAHGLSDLSTEDQKALKQVWQDLLPSYKHKVIQSLVHASEVNFEYNFKRMALVGLKDESAMVRSASIDLLWEDESVAIMRLLLDLIRNDQSSNVKAQALVGLSKFILLGEYEDIPASMAKEAQELSLQLHTDETEPVEVRRRALEAVSNSSHPNKDRLIKQAYHSDNHLMKVSSIFAMGRTCDDKWQEILLEELENDDHEMVYEAVRACGEIQLESSMHQLKELLMSDDREIQTMAIWALGEIGGKDAIDTLSILQETTEEEDMLEIIDEAIDVASFSFMGAGFDFDIED